MLARKNIISSVIIAAFLLVNVLLAQASDAVVEMYVAKYKEASQELVRLYTDVTNEATAKDAEAKILAATERQKSAMEALGVAIRTLNPKNTEDSKTIEDAFSEMQTANEAVSAAQYKSLESRAASALEENARALQEQQTPVKSQLVGASVQKDLPPALSSSDLKKVMAWIAQEVSNYRQSYCYRDSYGRGVGKPMKCAAGQDQDAGLCYTPCRDGYKGVGPVCWQRCAPEFRDDGAYCGKPKSYGRGAGYPWKFGDGLNDKGMRRRCEKANPQGCEKNGLIYYPKCKPGYHAFGCCICSPNCQLGQTDIGISCQKKSYGRGVGKPLSTCRDDQDKDALLCYPKCRSGYHGIGPVCWQDCPSGRSNCGVGCTTGKTSCVMGTISMVTSPLILAVNIITLGSSSPATSASKLSNISQKIKKLYKATEDIRKLYKDVERAGTLAYEVKKITNTWVNDYVGDFESMTTKRVATELSKHFSGDALLWVKQQYAMNHLTLLLKSDGIETAQSVLSIVSTFDPSGVLGVIDAFAKPVCKTDQDFPEVTLISQASLSPENESGD